MPKSFYHKEYYDCADFFFLKNQAYRVNNNFKRWIFYQYLIEFDSKSIYTLNQTKTGVNTNFNTSLIRSVKILLKGRHIVIYTTLYYIYLMLNVNLLIMLYASLIYKLV